LFATETAGVGCGIHRWQDRKTERAGKPPGGRKTFSLGQPLSHCHR
jgi:hypothetical protein